MLAVFCLRLGLGMLAALALLSYRQMHARFFRTHFLTVLGAAIVALIMAWDTAMRLPISIATALAFVGSLIWTLERPPLGWTLWALTVVALAAALACAGPPRGDSTVALPFVARMGNDLASALLLGGGVTAMLVGHSYLIAPALTIQPLMRMLALVGLALLLRGLIAGVALGFWTADHSLTNLNDETVLFLPVRWLVGIAGPALFSFLAFRTAQIRSTQSATGILYVVVILVFLGELIGALLFRITGLPL